MYFSWLSIPNYSLNFSQPWWNTLWMTIKFCVIDLLLDSELKIIKYNFEAFIFIATIVWNDHSSPIFEHLNYSFSITLTFLYTVDKHNYSYLSWTFLLCLNCSILPPFKFRLTFLANIQILLLLDVNYCLYNNHYKKKKRIRYCCTFFQKVIAWSNFTQIDRGIVSSSPLMIYL